MYVSAVPRFCEDWTLVKLVKWKIPKYIWLFFSAFSCIISTLYFFLAERRRLCPRTFSKQLFQGWNRYEEKRTFDRDYFDLPLLLRIRLKGFTVCGEQQMMMSSHLLSLLGCQQITQIKVLILPGLKGLYLFQIRVEQGESIFKAVKYFPVLHLLKK